MTSETQLETVTVRSEPFFCYYCRHSFTSWKELTEHLDDVAAVGGDGFTE